MLGMESRHDGQSVATPVATSTTSADPQTVATFAAEIFPPQQTARGWGARAADSSNRVRMLTGDLRNRLAGMRHRLNAPERARHAVPPWRLRQSYIAYCAFCAITTAALLVWNIVQGARHHWDLPSWKEHPWEEFIEIAICLCFVLETLGSLIVIGGRSFLRSVGCMFDSAVALLSVASIIYGVKAVHYHLSRGEAYIDANVTMAVLRFILQPLRVFTACWHTVRARLLQHEVEELRVDFAVVEEAGLSLRPVSSSWREA